MEKPREIFIAVDARGYYSTSATLKENIQFFVSKNEGLRIERYVPESEIERLVALNQKYKEALEFYANKDNYGTDDKSRTTGNITYDICLFDFDRNMGPGQDFAGRRARVALSDPVKIEKRERLK